MARACTTLAVDISLCRLVDDNESNAESIRLVLDGIVDGGWIMKSCGGLMMLLGELKQAEQFDR